MFTVKRSAHNPLLSPRREHPWEAAAAYNWCPVKVGATTHFVYRALSEKELLEEPRIHRSIIAHATTKNGKDFSLASDRETAATGTCSDLACTYSNNSKYEVEISLNGKFELVGNILTHTGAGKVSAPGIEETFTWNETYTKAE